MNQKQHSSRDSNHPGQPTPATDEPLADPDALCALDEAAYESFPASDPPSYSGSACSPSSPRPSAAKPTAIPPDDTSGKESSTEERSGSDR